ncbi:hypothetical protein PMZ80_002592 [Knufia obscura]|uniref:Phospholipid/glycerol acyltransferase domain-containing protein n=1 Tax=Knufia obscura TaxID=1635080 RepID=A0ABR0RXU1_9EURO|nr:hypothetical protein PMZ80_002592 [Knufia obscura]
MDIEGLRKRSEETVKEKLDLGAGASVKADEPHPAGEVKHGPLVQILRAIASIGWAFTSCIVIHITQFIGAPLYFWNKDYYYAWMALTKQSFVIILLTVSRLFSPTVVRISWDPSMRGQLRKTQDGRLETSFPERIVLMANHQIYTDWIYLWWSAYTSQMHGHLYILLKESLRYIPLLGPGMMFYGFIFMARKWASDKPRLAHRLQQLKTKHSGPESGSASLDPMWLLIFPEGTNLSANTRKKSVAWSQKSGIPDMKHQLLPRATGMHFCLQELKGTVDWVYDCTVAYEGVPLNGYAQDYFSLRSTFLQGRPPKSVNFHWRRFALADIPLDDLKDFEKWIEARWREKDEMLEQYKTTGRFPADNEDDDTKAPAYIETDVSLKSWAELLQPYIVVLTLLLVLNIIRKFWKQFVSG